jgi:hypothetical protein
MPASGVLASFRPSTYPRGYASALHSLRPCWTAILSTLRERYPIVPHARAPSTFQLATILMGSEPAWRELPDSEGTAIEMDELRAWIKSYPAVSQPQRGMAKIAKLDTGNIEVERLPLDM